MQSMNTLFGQFDAMILSQFSIWSIWNSTWPYMLMLVGFSVIVFVHELGHFAVAKAVGVRVERFAIGFGREIFGFTKGETRYSFNVLPLGGYVKMLGQEDFEDKEGELQFKDDPRSFINKPVSSRMAIVSAGVVMNVLFAFFLFMIVFMIGMDAQSTRIGYVDPDSPADVGGLTAGDNIKHINGDFVREWRDISMAIQLAAPHTPIHFDVVRDGEHKTINVIPGYPRPENSREPRRQIVGIGSGRTREIAWVGPELDPDKPDSPHVGDMIVEVDGVTLDNTNINRILKTIHLASNIYVERKDDKHPDATPKRIRVHIPPQLGIVPADPTDMESISILGLTPLVRFSNMDLRGRAYLAGLETGDTILSWNDITYPSRAEITRAIRYNTEKDIPFKVLKPDGSLFSGFVRPKTNRQGAATIQASWRTTPKSERSDEDPKIAIWYVRPFGQAAQAGFEVGDQIVAIDSIVNPSLIEMSSLVQESHDTGLRVKLRKRDGRVVETIVVPEAPGSIDAAYNQIAVDLLRTGRLVDTINGKPSPAALAGIRKGALIEAVGNKAVATWRDLIAAFEENAGTTVDITYIDENKGRQIAKMPIPNSLRTILGVGPEAGIISIDGKKSLKVLVAAKEKEVRAGWALGTLRLLTNLVGQKKVPIEYRKTPISKPQVAYIDVTEDMVDPWLGRIKYFPNIDVMPDMEPLKGKNAFDAISIGVHKTYYFVMQVYETMNRMIFSRTVGTENLSGPLGIVSVGGQIARAGFVKFLFFMAIISANLAVINFLPLPIVDGGLMVFLLIEKIKGSPVSIRIQVLTQSIGIVLIIGAFAYVTYNDAVRMLG